MEFQKKQCFAARLETSESFYSNAPRSSLHTTLKSPNLVPTLGVGMPSWPLRGHWGLQDATDAERQRRHSHAERGNEAF